MDESRSHHRLSDWFLSGPPFPPVDRDSEYARIKSAMNAGDWIREQSKRADIMAIHAASRIAESRERESETRRAHILRSLKRPEEVEYLRWLYGPRFILISAYVPRRRRISYLATKMSEPEAVELVTRDEDAESEFGQATDKTFQLADLFVNADLGPVALTDEVGRFLDLVLGSPLVTPRKEEHAMFLAYASSLRSGDLSRQVGAVITAEDGTWSPKGRTTRRDSVVPDSGLVPVTAGILRLVMTPTLKSSVKWSIRSSLRSVTRARSGWKPTAKPSRLCSRLLASWTSPSLDEPYMQRWTR